VIYEQLDDDDRDVLLLLGYTVGRAQLLEHALLKLLEAQHFNDDADQDERWHEIQHWLTKYTARRTANKLRVPEEIATDLGELVTGRDFLVHHSYRFYLSARGTRGDEVVREYLEWFHGLSAALGYGYNGLMSIVAALQERANSELDGEALMRLWRNHVSEPVRGFTPPDPRLAQNGS
jgi:hypothetical protein